MEKKGCDTGFSLVEDRDWGRGRRYLKIHIQYLYELNRCGLLLFGLVNWCNVTLAPCEFLSSIIARLTPPGVM